MNSIRVWIKGNPSETERAIRLHIRHAAAKFVHDLHNMQECAWDIHPDHRAAVVAWFTEPPHSAPYPIGTLLFYSEAKS